jgi:Tol biopolymer transport system component
VDDSPRWQRGSARAAAWGPAWSSDGRWLYYWRLERRAWRHREDPDRRRRARDTAGRQHAQRDGSVTGRRDVVPDAVCAFLRGLWGMGFTEYIRARPFDGPGETIARVAAGRVPTRLPNIALSPDGEHLAVLLIDGATTNIWRLPASGGAMSPITDYGDRCTLIVRNVSWSRDGQHIYAAVAERQTEWCCWPDDLAGIRRQNREQGGLSQNRSLDPGPDSSVTPDS